jgi:hypothetical protein
MERKTFKMIFTRLSFVLIIFLGCGGGGGSSVPSSNDPVSLTISGSAQKGPYQQGSTIVIYGLDDAFNQTGTSFQTEIMNDLGEYTLPVNLRSRYVELFATGLFYNEIDGQMLPSGLTLNAVAEVTGDSTINLNFLTSLAKPRTIQLIANGATFEDAKTQANYEVLDALGFDLPNMALFEFMDILKAGDDNGLLLAASSVIMQMATIYEGLDSLPALNDIMTTLKNDIGEDGIIDDPYLNTLIQEAVCTVDTSTIRSNLESDFLGVNSQVVIPEFESFITENTLMAHSRFQGDYVLAGQLWPGSTETFPIEMTIHNQLHISGTIDTTMVGVYPITDGQVNEDGTFSFGYDWADFSPVFTGTISDDGSVEGNWVCIFNTGELCPISGHKL